MAWKHDDEPAQALPFGEGMLKQLRHILTCGEPVLAHNALYELCWAQAVDCWDEATYRQHPATFIDTQIRAVLRRKLPTEGTSLDAEAQRYNLPLKPVQALWTAIRKSIPAVDWEKINPENPRAKKTDPREHLHKIKDQDLVLEYCKHDVEVTYQVYLAQLHDRDFTSLKQDIVVLEETLLPILALMQFRGIPVDVARLKELETYYKTVYDKIRARIHTLTGECPAKLTATHETRAFIEKHLEPELHERTETGLLKVSSGLIGQSKNPVMRLYAAAAKIQTVSSNFVVPYLLAEHKGRIYPSINQVAMERENEKKEDGQGTKTGRFSYSKPTMQNLPSKDKAGKLMFLFRSVIRPKEEGMGILSCDLKQQEPRWIVHCAKEWGVEGVEQIVRDYNEGRPPDSHDMATRAIYPHLAKVAKIDKGLPERGVGKAFNLATGYGGGVARLSKATGLTPDETRKALALYWQGMPHLKGTMDYAKKQAEKYGFVETPMGRRKYFELWEPNGWAWYYRTVNPLRYDTSPDAEAFKKLMLKQKDAVRGVPLPLAEAKRKYTSLGWPIQRSGLHKALNAIIQGASADQIKLILIRLFWRNNLLALASIHDEILAEVPLEGGFDVIKTILHTMETAVDLHVPMASSAELGTNWYACKPLNFL
jgi:DNA polymerase-1